MTHRIETATTMTTKMEEEQARFQLTQTIQLMLHRRRHLDSRVHLVQVQVQPVQLFVHRRHRHQRTNQPYQLWRHQWRHQELYYLLFIYP